MLHVHAVKCFCLIILFFFHSVFRQLKIVSLQNKMYFQFLFYGLIWWHVLLRKQFEIVLYYIILCNLYSGDAISTEEQTNLIKKKNHNVPVALIVIKRKLSPGDSLFLLNSPTYSGGAFGEHRKSSHTVHHKDKPNSKVDEEFFEFQIKSFVF